MGRKRNPGSKFKWHSNAPRCPVCGKRTPRKIHKKCEGKPRLFEQRVSVERIPRQRSRNADPVDPVEVVNFPEMYERPLL